MSFLRVAVMFGLCGALILGISGSAAPQSTSEGDASPLLTCGSPDIPVLDAIVEVGEDLPGGPESPEAALGQFSGNFPETRGLPVQAFRRSEVAEGRVTMALDRGSDRRGLAIAEHIGDSWYLMYFAVCTSEIS